MRNVPIVAALLLLFAIPSANAGLLIEPFVGYGTGNNTFTVSGTGTTPTLDGTFKGTGKGVAYGGRVGYVFSILMAGGEYQTASFKSSGDDQKPTETNAFVGIRLPVGLSVLGGYTLSNKGYELKGNGGYKALIGFRFLPLVQLNLEYIVRKYNDVDPRPAGVNAASTFITETKSYQLSISLPLEL